MSTISRTGSEQDVDTVVSTMRSRICSALGKQIDLPGSSVVRLSIEIPGVDPLSWLSAQNAEEKLYWSDREREFAVGGIGIADQIKPNNASEIPDTLTEVQKRLDAAPTGTRYYGGFRFDASSRVSPEWSIFGIGRFILPRFELITEGGQTSFVCNLIPKNDRNQQELILEMLDDIRFEVDDDLVPFPRRIARVDLPDFSDWSRILTKASDAFASGEYDKIVLGRRTVLEFAEPVSSAATLNSLAGETAGCFHFCFQPERATAFIGASPERLYFRRQQSFECEALAGTRPRGSTAVEDARLGNQLLDSEKDVREHRYVIDGLRESLDKMILSGFPKELSKVTLRKLARVQHLVVQFNLQLHPNVSDRDLLEALHPTAAVGGYPREGITHHISDLEPFDRGWYAGPVGWIAKDGAEFAVAIRSGLVHGNGLSLYAGAGILRGSDVANEWNELENKLGTFLNAVTR